MASTLCCFTSLGVLVLGLLHVPVSCAHMFGYMPAHPTNSSQEVVDLNIASFVLDMRWFSHGSYSQNVTHQLAGHHSQGTSKFEGALIHLSQAKFNVQTPPTDTPWIALISCDYNATFTSQKFDVFALAHSKGAVAALLYSRYSQSCLVNTEYKNSPTHNHSFSVFSTWNLTSVSLIERQFEHVDKHLYGDYDSHRLNESSPMINAAIQAGTPQVAGYLFGILQAYDTTTQISNGTGTNERPRKKKHTAVGFIVLYVIIGCLSSLFLFIIALGVIRAMRHPELYGPGKTGQSYARGLACAIIDTFTLHTSRRSSQGPTLLPGVTIVQRPREDLEAHDNGLVAGNVTRLVMDSCSQKTVPPKDGGLIVEKTADSDSSGQVTTRPRAHRSSAETAQTGGAVLPQTDTNGAVLEDIMESETVQIKGQGTTQPKTDPVVVGSGAGSILINENTRLHQPAPPEGHPPVATIEEGDNYIQLESLPSLDERFVLYHRAAEQQLREIEDKSQQNFGTIIGIDFGTTYSRVGVQQDGEFLVIPNERGERATPSCVTFSGNKQLVGNKGDLKDTIYGIKHLLGRRINDEGVARDVKQRPFTVGEKKEKLVITLGNQGDNRDFSPQEICGMILTQMKKNAEAHLDRQVTHAVVTVPACFNNDQRQAIQDAGTKAGLTIVRNLNEPAAVALAYGRDKKDANAKIIVYNLGGGNFDTSLFFIRDGVVGSLATAGGTRLGGDEFDRRVVAYLVEEYNVKTGRDVRHNTSAVWKLTQAVEEAKRILSTEQSARVEIEDFEEGNGFSETLTRAKFEELNMDLFRVTIKLVGQVLRDAGVERHEVDKIVLGGGSSKIPKIQQLLVEYFGKNKLEQSDLLYAAVCGAAVHGGIVGGVKGHTGVVLVDSHPLTLGIEVFGGNFAPIIPRNTIIPAKRSEIFTTVTDYQTVVSLCVYEGEKRKVADNNLLGQFELAGIRVARKGVPRIEVTFEVDLSGILRVTAVDKDGSSNESIVIAMTPY